MKKNILCLIILLISFATDAFSQSAKRFLADGLESANKKRYTEAIDYFNKAININPNLYEAYLERGKANIALNNKSEALNDLKKAIDIKNDEEEAYIVLGNYHLSNKNFSEAFAVSKTGLGAKKNSFKGYQILALSKLGLNDAKGALESIDLAISSEKSNPESWYIKSLVYDSLNNKPLALQAIKKSNELLLKWEDFKKEENKHLFLKYYIQLAYEQYVNNLADECITTCNTNISLFPEESIFYYYRGLANAHKMKMTLALDDLTLALTKSEKETKYFCSRGSIFFKLGQTESALSDFIKAISLDRNNFEAQKGKGKCLESASNFELAQDAYKLALALNPNDYEIKTLCENIKVKIFESYREKNAPEIYLDGADNVKENVCYIPRNSMIFEVKGTVKDKSRIRSIMVMDEKANFDSNLVNPKFSYNLKTLLKDEFSIRAEDVYSNVTQKVYTIKRSESDLPIITLNSPFDMEKREVTISEQTGYLLSVSGKAKDESPIRKIQVNSKIPSFNLDATESDFATDIDIVGLDSIVVSATDIFNNVAKCTFKIIRPSQSDTTVNPMGKTWAIFIDNSNYKNLPILEATSNDVVAMNSALENYTIDKVIIKKDMTKAQMDKFFAIELRDLVAENNVNSIMIWFAGHGKFLNETGYWLPVDANKKEEFSFFALSQLKSYLANYKKVKHTLVVSDACETGPAFYLAMRDINANRNCGEWEATKLKSAQVMSSSTLDLNDDKSIFTKSFVSALKGVNDRCISIEKISEKVSISAKQNQKPKPKLGNIQGLQDENGTFFFIKK